MNRVGMLYLVNNFDFVVVSSYFAAKTVWAPNYGFKHFFLSGPEKLLGPRQSA